MHWRNFHDDTCMVVFDRLFAGFSLKPGSCQKRVPACFKVPKMDFGINEADPRQKPAHETDYQLRRGVIAENQANGN